MEPRERIQYLPIDERPPMAWPDGARVAVWVAPNIEHYEFTPPPSGPRATWPRLTTSPDVQQYSFRDYGNRVAVWRMAELFADLGVVPTVSLNLAVLEHYPEITALIRDSGWAVMSHGLYNTRYIYEYSEDEEREFYRDSIQTLEEYTGLRLRGMLGPAISGTERTPDLMAEAGLIYHTDWVHDDQPVPIKTETGRLVSVPYSYELNDAPLFGKHYTSRYFAEMCRRQFDRLYAEGDGRVVCLAIHPFLIAQPHAIGHLREILDYIKSHDQVWLTTADEIAQHYIRHDYDRHVEAAEAAATRGKD